LPLAFGFGSPADLAIIFVLVLLIFGPNKLPELGKQLGQAMKEIRKITDEFSGAAASIRSEVEPVFKTNLLDTTRRTVPEVLAPAETVEETVPVDASVVKHESPETIPTGGLRISSLPPSLSGSEDKGE